MNSYSDHNNSIQHWPKISLLNDCRRKKNFKIDHILCLMVRWALKKKKNSESRSLKWAKYSRPRPWTCNTHTLSYTLNVIQVRELKLKRVIHKFIIQSKNFIDIFDFIINTDCYENQIYIYISYLLYLWTTMNRHQKDNLLLCILPALFRVGANSLINEARSYGQKRLRR